MNKCLFVGGFLQDDCVVGEQPGQLDSVSDQLTIQSTAANQSEY
jgi:hypothetical protein